MADANKSAREMTTILLHDLQFSFIGILSVTMKPIQADTTISTTKNVRAWLCCQAGVNVCLVRCRVVSYDQSPTLRYELKLGWIRFHE